MKVQISVGEAVEAALTSIDNRPLLDILGQHLDVKARYWAGKTFTQVRATANTYQESHQGAIRTYGEEVETVDDKGKSVRTGTWRLKKENFEAVMAQLAELRAEQEEIDVYNPIRLESLKDPESLSAEVISRLWFLFDEESIICE